MKKIITTISIVAAYFMINGSLWACASCNVLFNFSKEKIDAYFDTTLMMGILPVSFIGLLCILAYKSSKSVDDNNQ